MYREDVAPLQELVKLHSGVCLLTLGTRCREVAHLAAKCRSKTSHLTADIAQAYDAPLLATNLESESVEAEGAVGVGIATIVEIFIEIYDMTGKGKRRGECGFGNGRGRVTNGILNLDAKLLGRHQVYIVHTRSSNANQLKVRELAHCLAINHHLVRDGDCSTLQALHDILFACVFVGCVVALLSYLRHIATRDTVLI